jgi:hypothetical protein
MHKKLQGSPLDDFLAEGYRPAEAEAIVAKRVLASLGRKLHIELV